MYLHLHQQCSDCPRFTDVRSEITLSHLRRPAFPTSSSTASTSTPFVTSNTPLTVFSLVYKMMRSPPWVFASSPPWHPSTSCQRQCRSSRLGGNSTESSSSDIDESRVALLDFVRLAHVRGDGRCLHETNSSDSGVIPKFWGDGDVLHVCAWKTLRGQGKIIGPKLGNATVVRCVQ